jgi:hypothetical protein
MEEGNRKRGWRNRPLWWDIEPDDLRALYLRGGGDAAIARSIGFFLAAVAVVAETVLGIVALWRDGQDAAGYERLAAALAYLVLGGLMRRGRSWAALGLMALYTIDRGIGNWTAYTEEYPYYAGHPGLWLCLGALGWAMWMRVFYVAYRLDPGSSPGQAGTAGQDAPARAES